MVYSNVYSVALCELIRPESCEDFLVGDSVGGHFILI